ncbi:MAG: hypothetical protein K8S94_05895 [Planctomycetia bacterium]|nr:hypothetical protein [Planctomycetia bacterium]
MADGHGRRSEAGTLAGFGDGREDMVFPEERQTRLATAHDAKEHSGVG